MLVRLASFPSADVSEVAGAEVTLGDELVIGVVVRRVGALAGAVITLRGGAGLTVGARTMNPPIASPTAAPASPSRNWGRSLMSSILDFVY